MAFIEGCLSFHHSICKFLLPSVLLGCGVSLDFSQSFWLSCVLLSLLKTGFTLLDHFGGLSYGLIRPSQSECVQQQSYWRVGSPQGALLDGKVKMSMVLQWLFPAQSWRFGDLSSIGRFMSRAALRYFRFPKWNLRGRKIMDNSPIRSDSIRKKNCIWTLLHRSSRLIWWKGLTCNFFHRIFLGHS
jgi:hypothetical protein